MERERKLLRRQLELLAEQSGGAMESELAEMSIAMCRVYSELSRPTLRICLALLFAVCLDLLVSILILIQ